MLMRTDPFRDLDRLTQQVLGTGGSFAHRARRSKRDAHALTAYRFAPAGAPNPSSGRFPAVASRRAGTVVVPGGSCQPMVQSGDLYAVLGVHPSATQEQVRRAYRALMRLHHPDTRSESASSEPAQKQAPGLVGDEGEPAIRVGPVRWHGWGRGRPG